MLTTAVVKDRRNYLQQGINQVAKSRPGMGGQVKVYVIDPRKLQQRLEAMVHNLPNLKETNETTTEAAGAKPTEDLEKNEADEKRSERNRSRKRKRKQAREIILEKKGKAEEAAELSYLMKPPTTTRVGRVSKNLSHVKSAQNKEVKQNNLPKIRKREPPEMFRCQACQKVYLGYTKLFSHFSKFPDHQMISSKPLNTTTVPVPSQLAKGSMPGQQTEGLFEKTETKTQSNFYGNPTKETADAEVQVQVHVVEIPPEQQSDMILVTNPSITSTNITTNHLQLQNRLTTSEESLPLQQTANVSINDNCNFTNSTLNNPLLMQASAQITQPIALPDLCMPDRLSLQIGNDQNANADFCLSSFGAFTSSGHHFHIPDRNQCQVIAQSIIDSNCIDIHTADSNVSVDLQIFEDSVSHTDIIHSQLHLQHNEDTMLMDSNSNSVFFHCPEISSQNRAVTPTVDSVGDGLDHLQTNFSNDIQTTDKTTWQFVKQLIKTQGINQACGEISEMADKLSKVARDKFIPVREDELERLGNSVPIIQVDTPFFSHLLDLPFGTYIYKEDAGIRKVVPPPPPTAELSLTGGVEVDIDKFLSPDIDLINLPHLTNLDFTAICNNSS